MPQRLWRQNLTRATHVQFLIRLLWRLFYDDFCSVRENILNKNISTTKKQTHYMAISPRQPCKLAPELSAILDFHVASTRYCLPTHPVLKSFSFCNIVCWHGSRSHYRNSTLKVSRWTVNPKILHKMSFPSLTYRNNTFTSAVGTGENKMQPKYLAQTRKQSFMY